MRDPPPEIKFPKRIYLLNYIIARFPVRNRTESEITQIKMESLFVGKQTDHNDYFRGHSSPTTSSPRLSASYARRPLGPTFIISILVALQWQPPNNRTRTMSMGDCINAEIKGPNRSAAQTFNVNCTSCALGGLLIPLQNLDVHHQHYTVEQKEKNFEEVE